MECPRGNSTLEENLYHVSSKIAVRYFVSRHKATSRLSKLLRPRCVTPDSVDFKTVSRVLNAQHNNKFVKLPPLIAPWSGVILPKLAPKLRLLTRGCCKVTPPPKCAYNGVTKNSPSRTAPARKLPPSQKSSLLGETFPRLSFTFEIATITDTFIAAAFQRF